MPPKYDPRATLPSEAFADSDAEQHLECFAVIAFHPDERRIGESCVQRLTDEDLVFGRDVPCFSPARGPGAGLDDRRVSRRAFELAGSDGSWTVRRVPGSSRLRVNGCELLEERRLSLEEQRCGVVLTLGQRVVLHLRIRYAEEQSHAWPEELERALPGVGRAACALRQATAEAASATGDVLLLGPTGTGKEHVARAIHDLSAEPTRPWVPVNMAALAPDIATASLFGVRKGAYTGADAHRPGYFQQASGGTLFLDEIADAPAAVQPLLLRALQEREIQVLGGATEQVSLRVVAAMENDPDHGDEALRPALRYRLGSREIRLSPLAERAEDIGLLALLFLHQHREPGRCWSSTDDMQLGAWAHCFETLLLHQWPGNLRELKQVVAQLQRTPLEPPKLPQHLQYAVGARHAESEISESESPASVARVDSDEPLVTAASLAALDDRDFADAWARAGFEVTAMAREYGVSRAAIYRRIARSPLCRLAADVPLGELLAVLDQCRGDLQTTAEKLAVSRRGLATRLRASGVQVPAGPEADGLPADG